MNKVESYCDENFSGNYGISQNPDTKDYILVFSQDYLKQYCKVCYNKYEFEWCKTCQMNILKKIEGNCLITTIWKNAPFYYDISKKEWTRVSYEKTCLRNIYNSQYLTDKLLNEVESYLLDYENERQRYNESKKCQNYGVSQNPYTKNYILVFDIKYIQFYCEKCGNKYENSYSKWCQACQINYFKNNFTNWTSGNEKIDDLIQEEQLKYGGHGHGTVFEWIPYNMINPLWKYHMRRL
ncbi:kinase-like domain-containing protein [Rhizophagus clarus]|uniref:Kinase-like domain-containing protein n=1 Tax=Rhizophagus clarus TaxID=94130 RepID=A0A8H3KPH0_9GLOM|nr:kinase-like domain-containing protein [Rhizophagus clarus]